MSILFDKIRNAFSFRTKSICAMDIKPYNPYCKMNDGLLIYQNKSGQWLDENQQPRPKKPKKYNPHTSTRYKNVVLGENGIPKAYDIKTETLKETEKNLPELYLRREECCGCGACYSICPIRNFLKDEGENSIGNYGENYTLPHGAIYMEEDEEGFLYPVVDASLCIRCYKCEKVCPLKNR